MLLKKLYLLPGFLFSFSILACQISESISGAAGGHITQGLALGLCFVRKSNGIELNCTFEMPGSLLMVISI